MYGYHKSDVVYIKFMKFANSNLIDYRIKGRPYLIYKIEDEKFYLLKLGSSKILPEYFSYNVNLVVKGKKIKRKSYVDMRYIMVVDADKLIASIDAYNDEPFCRRNKHSSRISKEDYNIISNQIKILDKIRKIRLVDKNYDYIFNV